MYRHRMSETYIEASPKQAACDAVAARTLGQHVAKRRKPTAEILDEGFRPWKSALIPLPCSLGVTCIGLRRSVQVDTEAWR